MIDLADLKQLQIRLAAAPQDYLALHSSDLFTLRDELMEYSGSSAVPGWMKFAYFKNIINIYMFYSRIK
ncbi:hypothetical protein CHELA1G11_20665 [Hyphomicrobiales bacterium]|nr:hypothetical protein CHELA1G11_20665 [Hyphomicrobiales bacterium]CAH1691318.1 hypothetical protein CHELA1G2_20979 [Hyphomicrobiales bacterium]